MPYKFKTIGLVGRLNSPVSTQTVNSVLNFLLDEQCAVVLEEKTAVTHATHALPNYSLAEIGQYCDLVIVVGGDGTLLNAAQAIVEHQTPLLGVNRGQLGFLTDIHPDQAINKIKDILNGDFTTEKRFLLSASVSSETKNYHLGSALNDIVLMHRNSAHMVEFEVYINEQFVCQHRADGYIISTPTGSTAYALSGGGPILYPDLDAVALLPMFPHNLSSRPIVVGGNSKICIKINPNCDTNSTVACDGHDCVTIKAGECLTVEKKSQQVKLIHPLDYDYFQTLRSKLQWETRLVNKNH